jgi:hypothetical protein
MKKFILELASKYPNGIEVETAVNGKTTKRVIVGQDLINWTLSKVRNLKDAEELFKSLAKTEKPKKEDKEDK